MQNEQLRPEWYHWIVLLQPNVEGFHLNIKSTPGFRGPTVKLHGLSWVRRCALPGWSVGLFSQSFQSPQNPYGSEMSRTSFYQDFPILHHFTKFLFWDILHYLLLSDDRSQAQPATGCLLLVSYRPIIICYLCNSLDLPKLPLKNQ